MVGKKFHEISEWSQDISYGSCFKLSCENKSAMVQVMVWKLVKSQPIPDREWHCSRIWNEYQDDSVDGMTLQIIICNIAVTYIEGKKIIDAKWSM